MKSLTLLVSAALAVQKLSVMTWIWGRKTILWMNSSAAEKLCGFSGILWYPVDIWSILSLLQHLSKGSIFLTVLPSNSLPDMSFSCLLTPACSVSPQDLCCRGAAEDKEVISATVSVRVSPSQLCSCIPGCVERVSMEECMEVWEIWHWCFPLLYNHLYKTLTLLIFLHHLSSKIPRMMTLQVWALLVMETDKHSRSCCGDISDVSRGEIKGSDLNVDGDLPW